MAKQQNIQVQKNADGSITVQSPYNPTFLAFAKSVNANYDANTKARAFQSILEPIVMQQLQACYGYTPYAQPASPAPRQYVSALGYQRVDTNLVKSAVQPQIMSIPTAKRDMDSFTILHELMGQLLNGKQLDDGQKEMLIDFADWVVNGKKPY